MGGGTGTGVGIFSCPGDCAICNLKDDTCPMRGSFKPKSDEKEKEKPDQTAKIAILIANALEKYEEMAFDVISPEVLFKRLESGIDRLAQAVEIIVEEGEEMTKEALEKDILNLIPMERFGSLNERIRNKLSAVISVIAIKIIQTSKSGCSDQGSLCTDCYLASVCTQRKRSQL